VRMRRGDTCVHESNYGNRRLLRARGEGQRSRRSGNPCNKIASSHCLPEAWDHAKISCPTQAIKTGICDQRYGAQWSICAAKILSRPCRLGVKAGRGVMSALMSGLPESGRRADIGRLSERAIPVIANHHSRNGRLWNVRGDVRYQSAFAPESLTTLAHFSVSLAKSLAKSAGDPGSGVPPSSAIRALILGSAKAALSS
jgi:hypothetical protein